MAAAFSLEALTKARESGFADSEIQSLLAEQDPKLGKAFESGFTLDEVADAFTQSKGMAPAQTGTDMLKRVPAGIAKASADALVGMSRIGRMLPKEVVPVRGIIDAVAPGLQQKAEQYVAGLGESAPAAYGVDPTKNETIPSKLIAGAASIVPAIASGPAAPFAMAGMMGESQRQEAIAKGEQNVLEGKPDVTEAQKTKAFVGGATVGALSEFLLGVPALLRSAKAAGIPEATFKAIVQKVSGQVVKSSVREGVQEGLDQAGQNLVASEIAAYDPGRPIMQGVKEAAGLGAIIGGPVGGVVQTAASLDAIREQSKAIDTTIEEVATAEPPPVVVDVTQGGVRTEETFAPGQAEPETTVTTGGNTAYEYQPRDLDKLDALNAQIQTLEQQVERDNEEAAANFGDKTDTAKERDRKLFQLKKQREQIQPISTPSAEPARESAPVPPTTAEVTESGAQADIAAAAQAARARYDTFDEQTGMHQITLMDEGGESTIYLKPEQATPEGIRDAVEYKRFEMAADSIDTPEKLDEFFRQQGIAAAPTAETSGAPQTPPTQPQPATATAESEMVPGDRPQPEGAAQLSAAQLEERIDLLLQKHQSETDPAVQSKLWAEAKALLEQSNKAGGQSMGPGAASAAETLVKYAERKFGIRFQDDPRIAAELKEAAGNRFYEVLPNKVTAAEATELIYNLGEDQAERMIRDEKAETPFAVRATVGQILVQRFNQQYAKLKESNREAANAVLNRAADASEWLLDYGTRLGQGVQAFAMWSRLSADGKLASIKKGIRKARENHRNRHGEELDEVLGALNTDRSVQEKEKDIRRLGRRNRIARQVRKKVKELAKQKQTAESFYEQTSRELGLPEMNAETEARIRALAAEVDAAEDGIPKFIKSGEFLRELKKIEGFNAADFLLTYYYGNILSGGGTQIVNAVDTFFNVLHDVNTMVLANPRAGATILSGLAKGLNEGKADAVLALTRGRKLSDGLMPGSMGVAEVVDFGKEGGVPQPGHGKLAEVAKKVLESRPAAIFNLYKYIFRAMGAADAVNFRGAQEARAGLLAHRIATDERLTSAQRTKRVNEILGWDRYDEFLAKAQEEGFSGQEQVARATELMMMQRPEGLQQDTSEFAAESTYNGKPKGFLGAVSNGINSIAGKYPATRLVVPFTQIVANVFNRRLDNLPPVAMYRVATGYYGSAEANKAAKVRMAMSLAMMGSLFALQEAGVLQITGQGPDDPEKLKQLKQSGWRPYSIKIGNRYYSYASLPISLGLGLIGNTMDWGRYRKPDEDRSFTDATAYAVFGMGSYLFSQSFLSGMADFFDSLRGRSGEASARKFLSSLASAVVPFSGALKDLDALYDDTKRENKTVKAALLANIPFGRFAGRPELNAFGEPIRTGRVRPLMRFTSKEGEDPAWRFVVDHGLKVPVGDPFFKTDPENYEYKKLSGQRMKQWILDNREVLGSLPKENAQKMLSDAGEAQRNEIKVELLMSGKYQKAK